MTRSSNFRRPQRGLSLLEVILALAILAGAMVMIGELVRMGTRHAASARDLSRGVSYCESLMSGIEAGIIPATSTQLQQLDIDPEWVFSIQVQPTQSAGLLGIYVSTQRADDTSVKPLRAELRRWIVDPSLLQQIYDEQKAAEEEAAANAIL